MKASITKRIGAYLIDVVLIFLVMSLISPIIPTFGEPYQLMDTLGVMTDTSLSWTSNGVEYYLISEVMSKDELIEVAQSIYELPVTSIK